MLKLDSSPDDRTRGINKRDMANNWYKSSGMLFA